MYQHRSNDEIRFFSISRSVNTSSLKEVSIIRWPDQADVITRYMFLQSSCLSFNTASTCFWFSYSFKIAALIRNWSFKSVISEFSCITLSSAAIALYLMRHKFGSLGISKLQQSIWDQWSSWNRKFGWNFNCEGNFRPNLAKGQNYLILFIYTVYCI